MPISDSNNAKTTLRDANMISALSSDLPSREDTNLSPVRRHARKHADAIFSSWHQLNSILQSHEAVIQQRWKQKTPNQRVRILLEAWPKMPAAHRPDFEAWIKEPVAQRTTNSKFVDHYLFPLINLEDLSKERPLLLMLNSRGRNNPGSFALADAKADAIVPIPLAGHVMIFGEGNTPETYGQLVSKADDPDASGRPPQQLLPGEGLLVMSIQERLLAFMVKIVNLILHDIDWSLSHPTLPDPGVTPSEQTLSRREERMEDAYRLPPAIDFAALESVVSAQLKAVRAHFVALREDPAYFAAMAAEFNEHRWEMMLDADGSPDPVARDPVGSILWDRILRAVILDAYLGLERWEVIHSQLLVVKRIHAQHASTLGVSKPLPDDLLEAFLHLQHYLGQLEKDLLNALKAAFFPSPPMRRWFERVTPAASASTHIQVQPKPDFGKDHTRHRVLSILNCVWDEDKRLDMGGVGSIMDIFETYVERVPSAGALLSPLILNILCGLGIIAEANRQISLFRPWAATFENAMVAGSPSREQVITRHCAERMLGLSEMLEDGIIPPAAVRRVLPLGENLTYPCHRRRTKDVVDVLRRSEANLDAFWGEVDEVLSPLVKAHPQLEGIGRFIGCEGRLELERTPEWQPSTDETTSAELPTSSLSAVNLSKDYHDPKHKSRVGIEEPDVGPALTNQQVVGAAPKVPEGESSDAAPSCPEVHSPGCGYTVSHKALKTFQILFHDPDEASEPGEIPWEDIVDALKETGLEGQKLAGSAWKFSPRAKDPHVKTSIILHQPHPSTNLTYRVARHYGRRLRREYDWHADSFVAKS